MLHQTSVKLFEFLETHMLTEHLTAMFYRSSIRKLWKAIHV